MGPNNTYKRALNEWYGNSIRETLTKSHKDVFEIEEKLIFPGIEITKVIFNDPATIVYWSDNTRTVVKCGEGDIFDPEKGLAMAIAKKSFGNNGNYYNEFKKWLPNE